LITIVPYSCFNPGTGWTTANPNYLPFVSVCNGSSTVPFASTPYFYASPFVQQAQNAVTFGIDSVQLNFI
jgi:hypothetical protein